VQQIEVAQRETPVFGGTEFGTVGTYERLHGTVFGELDPTHRPNAGIVNLDRAPRNTSGRVEYQSDFRIRKPLDLDRDNGCLIVRRAQSRQPADHATPPEGGHPRTPATVS
jgi:hypothetical protein